MSKVQQAWNIYSDNDLKTLLSRSGRFARRVFVTIDPIDNLCYHYSCKEIKKLRDSDNTIDDFLETTGYSTHRYDDEVDKYIDEGEIEGEFDGWGVYKCSRMLQQEKISITKLANEIIQEKPETIVEIGSAHGGSLYLWSNYIDSSQKLISIDVSHAGRYDEFFQNFAPSKEIACVTGDSHKERTYDRVEEELGDERVDFLYIDGDHSYDGVKRDFNLYKSLVADEGIIALHDISNSTTGVPSFWKEIQTEYETEEFGSGKAKNGIVRLGQ